MRLEGRLHDQLRPFTLEVGFSKYAEGSCFIRIGDTHVLVTASVEERIPPFLRNTGTGWLTAEYAMLPRSGKERSQRDSSKGVNGRGQEIQRLIGRSMRAIVELENIGERTITLDCDVIRSDGGTRTAAITAAYVATHQAMEWMIHRKMILFNPIKEAIAAISVGVCNGQELLDLDYSEDSTADVDMNVIMTASGKLVEIQGCAEKTPFGVDVLGKMLALSKKGIQELIEAQKEALGLS